MEDAVEAARQRLRGLLGDLPEAGGPVGVSATGQETRDGCVIEHLVLDLNGLEPVPAHLVRPAGGAGRLPAVLFNHSHSGQHGTGRDEMLTAVPYMQQPPYALDLARRGIASLAIDAWNFGERHHRTESALFKEMLWKGQVLWGMMVHDSLRALDYLASRPDIDPARVGTLGMSMGSTMAWWVAALDPRVAVCVDICCLTDFEALIATGGLDGHGIYYYVPRLLQHFDTASINALIAPRPHLALAGDLDPLTPPEGLERVDRQLRQIYAAAGAPDAWRLVRYPVGHTETAGMRAEALAFLERWL